MSTSHRFNALDGMRGVAAIAVMVYHMTQHTSLGLFENSELAVDLFFCLSGFVIAYAYWEKLQGGMAFLDFIKRRLIRLYPMYTIGFAIGAITLIGKVASEQTTLDSVQTANALLLNAFYLPYMSDYWIQTGNSKIPSALFPTNNPSWSLFFEIAINLIFGIWAIHSKRKPPLIFLTIGTIALVAYVRLTWTSAPGWGLGNFWGGVPRTVYGFFSGVLVFSIVSHYSKCIPQISPVLLLSLIAAIFALPHFSGGWSTLLWLGNTLITVPALVAIGSVSQSPRNSSITKALDYLGWLSYPIYCLHFPIYSIFTLLTSNSELGLFGLAVCFPVTIVVAHFATKNIEEPIRIILTRRFSSLSN